MQEGKQERGREGGGGRWRNGHRKENITHKHGVLQTSEHITGEEWRSLKWPPPAGYWHRETRTHN